MQHYENRQEAGRILAIQLREYKDKPNTIVLALPRGGVPVAYEIATELNLPLDVFLVRKLGVPGHEELAMGAIASGGGEVLNNDIIRQLQIPPAAIASVVQQELKELARREKVYRGDKPSLQIKNHTVILVDDGIATGATIRAAIKALRQLQPQELIVAVPTAEPETAKHIAALVDKFVCPYTPEMFMAVGMQYVEFNQTTDDEVITLLAQANQG